MVVSRGAPVPQAISHEAVLRDHRPELNRTLTLTPTPEQDKAQKHAEQVKAFHEKNKNPRDAIKSNEKITSSLSDTEKKQLNSVNSDLAKQAEQFDNYSSVVDEARRTHRSIEDVCKAHEKTDSGFESRFNDSQKAVVDQMIQASYVTGRIPGYKGMSDSNKRLAVEAYVAANPRVRELYVSEMSKIARDAINLSEDPTKAATNAKDSKVADLKGEKKVLLEQMRARLGVKDSDLTDDQIEQMYANGRNVDEVEMDMFDAMLKAQKIEPSAYHARQALQRMQALQGEFQISAGKGTKSTFNLEAYIQAHPADQRVIEYNALAVNEKTNIGLAAQIKSQDELTIQNVRNAVYGRANYDRGGVMVGGIRAELDKIDSNLRATKQAENQKSNVTPEAQAKADAERAVLKVRMEKLMEDSVERALLDDYDELEGDNQRKIAAEAQDAGELGELREKKAITDVNVRQKEHGVKTNEKGKKVINRTDIGDDARRISQDGDEGVRRIELRNLTEGDDPVISLKDKDGKPLYVDKNGKPCDDKASDKREATWRDVNYEQLSKEDRDLLDKIHESQGQRIAETVMVDYFFAQKPPMKGRELEIIGDKKALDLSPAQQADLARYLGGDQIREYFKQSREFSSFKDLLGEIQKSPGGEHNKFIAFLLLLLGMAGGLVKKRDDLI